MSYVDEFPRKKNPPPIQSAQIIPRNSHRTLFDHVWDQTQIHVHLYQFIGSRWTLARYKTPRVSVTLIRHSKYQTRSLMTYQNDWKNLEVSKPTKTGWLECRFFMTQLRSVLNLSYKLLCSIHVLTMAWTLYILLLPFNILIILSDVNWVLYIICNLNTFVVKLFKSR